MANTEELYEALRNADAAGDTESATKLSAYIQGLKTDSSVAAPKTRMEQLEELFPSGPKRESGLPEGNMLTGAAGTALGMAQNLGAGLYGNVKGVAKRVMGSSQEEAEAEAANTMREYSRQPSTEKEKEYTEFLGRTLGALPPVLGIGAAPSIGAAGKYALGKLGSRAGKLKTPIVLTAEESAKNATVKASLEAGYSIPPSQTVKPTLKGRALESIGGKLQTAQEASVRNQANTARLIKQDLGVPNEVALTPEVLNELRSNAWKSGYGNIENLPVDFKSTPKFRAKVDNIAKNLFDGRDELPGLFNKNSTEIQGLLDTLNKPSISPKGTVTAIRKLREDARANLRAFDNNEKLALGKAQKAGADALESLIDQNLSSTTHRMELFKALRQQGVTDLDPKSLLQNYRDARTLMAKTFSVEDALGPDGSIYADKLGTQQGKGKPLTGNLKAAADFARSFPKAAQKAEKIGGIPGWSPLDIPMSYTGAGTGAYVGGLMAGPPGSLIGGALGFATPIARPLARAKALKSSRSIMDEVLPPARGRGPLRGALSQLPTTGPALLPRAAIMGLSQPGMPRRVPYTLEARDESED